MHRQRCRRGVGVYGLRHVGSTSDGLLWAVMGCAVGAFLRVGDGR